MNPDFQLARRCAELSARAYDEATLTGPHSTQVLIEVIDGVQYVAFRGSKEARDFLTDARAMMVKSWCGRVHCGINEAFQDNKNVLWAALDSVKPIVFTGHSLGGALAMLAAYEWGFDYAGWRVKGVYTFGQPRMGAFDFAEIYNKGLGERTFRFIHEEDIVPRLPMPFRTFIHCGYRHCGNEIFLSSDGKTHLNATLVTKLCSDVYGTLRAYFNEGILVTFLNPLANHGMRHYTERLAKL